LAVAVSFVSLKIAEIWSTRCAERMASAEEAKLNIAENPVQLVVVFCALFVLK
jgi:hypothetical protein